MNTIGIIQARMSSNRLPGKVMLNLGNKKVIELCYEAALQSNVFKKIIVATSSNAESDKLVNFLKKKNINFYRGSEDNVFSRFREILIQNECDNFARLTADNPLIDPTIIKKVFVEHINKRNDYTSNTLVRSWPIGNDVEFIKSNTFLQLNINNLTKEELEHVTLKLKRIKNNLKIYNVTNLEKVKHPNARLTLDTNEDYKLISSVVEKLKLDEKQNSFELIDDFLNKNQKLLKINQNILQRDFVT